jgi:hypothetical protein
MIAAGSPIVRSGEVKLGRFSNWLSLKGIYLDGQAGNRLGDEADVLASAFVQNDRVPADLRDAFTKCRNVPVRFPAKRGDLLAQVVSGFSLT